MDVNLADNSIRVYNTGKGVPIIKHSEHKSLIPEMVFGELLTGSNFDDNEKKTTGGRNGYGAKLTNIFSKKFSLVTGEKKSKKILTIIWENNMNKIT